MDVYAILFQLSISFVCMWVVYMGLTYLGDKDKTRKWYLIHALANTANVYLALPAVIRTIVDPLKSLVGVNCTWAVCITVSLHLFHIAIEYRNMTIVDWLHHLFSCLLVCFFALVYFTAPLIEFIVFFKCGLPGGIDYYLLALNKYGLVSRITEKKINVFLNMWIRMPALLFACFCVYLSMLYVKHSYSIIVCTLLLFLHYYNPIYFARIVTENYGEHKMRIKLINNGEILKNIDINPKKSIYIYNHFTKNT